jgi:16S rRNA (guanine527-N7)-methyltransferase
MALEKLVEEGLQFFSIRHNEKIVDDLCLYIRELDKWNKRVNLTGLKEPTSVIRELLYDAFFLYSRIEGIGTVLDLGSGSGILGIPVKILDENLAVFSVDKSIKKVQFQRHVRRLLALRGFNPIHDRAEVLEPLRVDALIVKGFGTIAGILDAGGRHIAPGGYALILKGKAGEPVEYPKFSLEKAVPYHLPGSDKTYKFFVYKKLDAVDRDDLLL